MYFLFLVIVTYYQPVIIGSFDVLNALSLKLVIRYQSK
jgi:hypothetical protein